MNRAMPIRDLARSDASADAVLAALAHGVIAFDMALRLVACNPAAARLLAWPAPGAERDACADRLHAMLAAEGDVLRATLADASPRQLDDIALPCGDGGTLRVALDCAPVLDARGACVGAVLSFADPAPRQRLDAVRSTEARALELIASGADLPRVLDEIGAGLERLSPRGFALILQQGENGALRVAAAPSLPQGFRDGFDRLAAGSAAEDGPERLTEAPLVVPDIHSDERLRSLRPLARRFGLRGCWSMPIRDSGGRVVGSAALLLDRVIEPAPGDLTAMAYFLPLAAVAIEHQRKDEALRLGEERLRCAVNAGMEAVRDRDLRSGRSWCSHRPESNFAFDTAAGDAQAEWDAGIHPDDRVPMQLDLQRAIDSDAAHWEARYRLRRRDGSYGHVLDRAVLLRDPDGCALRLIGGIVDISAQIELEEQLHQSQRLESIGQLTGGVAHDFNNLLTVILGNAELLQELGQDRPALADLASMIRNAAQRGADLTQRLLAFARRQALAPRPVALDDLVQGLLPILRRSLGGAIEVELAAEDALDAALVDPAQLESALLNLCINARDAMPEGGRLCIEIGNAELDADYTTRYPELVPGRFVRLAVSDTGCGIPPENMARLFEPFFTTKERGKGTGLGLPMVYGFVKQSRGHITVYSEPGRGTAVKLYLPVADARPVAEPELADAALDASAGETVFLVEDDPMVREFARTQLLSLGYRTIEAGSGPEALEQIRAGLAFDLLFTDVVMPGGMTGVDLAAAARTLRPDLRVLFTSGYTANALLVQGRIPPGTLLLGKPYRRADLARHLRRALATLPASVAAAGAGTQATQA